MCAWLSAGKSEKITIKNDKGRLSEEEIERMVKEAEDFAEQVRYVSTRRWPPSEHVVPSCAQTVLCTAQPRTRSSIVLPWSAAISPCCLGSTCCQHDADILICDDRTRR